MMAARTAARESLELLLARTQPRESAFTRKRRTVERKPVPELDDLVLETYNNETPYELEVPAWAEQGTTRMLRKSVRFLEDSTGEEMRLKLQVVRSRNKALVKFMAHPPLERGRRVSRK